MATLGYMLTAMAAASGGYTNPLPVPVADPCVLRHGGIYYLYGTFGPDTHAGVMVHTSDDLVHWEQQGLAFAKSEETWSQTHFWGAEVVPHDGKFLMFYTASPEKDPGAPLNMFLCVAEGESPAGPFREVRTPLFQPPAGKQAIDQNVFIDDDGTAYLFFSFVEPRRNAIYGVKLRDGLQGMDGEPVLLIAPEDEWESRPWEGHRVAEGAHVIKHDGAYYMFYTGNHFLDPNYAVGYATAEHPLGPWTKAEENPILARTEFIHGPGNGAPVQSPDGTEWFLIYHVHESTAGVGIRQLALDRFRFEPRVNGPGRIVMTGPTHTPQRMPSGAVKGINWQTPPPEFFEHCAFVSVDLQGANEVKPPPTKEIAPVLVGQGWTVEDWNAGTDFLYDHAIPNAVKVADACRAMGLPMIFIHWGHRFADGADLSPRAYQNFMKEFGPDKSKWITHIDLPSSQPFPAFKVREGEYVIAKTDYDAFISSNIGFVLENLGVTNLVFVGGYTQGCLAETAKSAHQRGYKTLCIADATNNGRESQRLLGIETSGYDYVMNTSDLVALAAAPNKD